MNDVGTGTVLGGRYELHEQIGSGGMAGVWRGLDRVLDRPVAVKILHARLAEDDDLRERFRAEALAAARLTHPNIINVFDTGTDGEVAFIVMELFDGETLRQRLSREGALEPAEAVDIVIQVLSGLQFAHEAGVIHRDVKPANILVGPEGRAKVTDFGIAKAAYAGTDPTTTGRVLGSVPYLAPEQVEGTATDARSDIYACGATLYEALTARHPFTAETDIAAAMLRLTQDPTPPRAIRPGIPRPLDAIVMRALAREPEARFASAEDMAAALVRLQSVAAPSGSPPPRAPVMASPSQGGFFRRWMLVPLLALLLVAAAVAVGLLVGILEPGGPLGVRVPPESGEPTTTAPGARPLEATVEAFDPFGTLGENDEEAGFAIDGDPETAWRTENYDQLDLDKPGVGLLFDLGRQRRVTGFLLRTTGDGWQFEVRVGDDEEVLAAAAPAPDPFTATPSMRQDIEPTTGRLVLLWVTGVAPQTDGANRAVVGEFRVFGAGG